MARRRGRQDEDGRRPPPGAPSHPLAFGAALACVIAWPPAARAHPQYSPTASNRYLKLSLSGGGAVRVAWSLLVGEGPALAARRSADANRDGLVDERELMGHATDLARRVAAGLAIEVDGTRRDVQWEAPVVGLADRQVGPVPFSVDLVGKLAVAGAGPHVVHVDDGSAIEALGESEIRLEEGPGTRVLSAWRGREDPGRQLRFVWNGPKFSLLEDRSVGFRFVDERARRARRLRLPLSLGGALVAAAAAAMLVLRRRDRPRGK